jgi:hypothetical protein
MTDYTGEGLIKCQDCGATVPSFESLIDLPGAPEHMTPCFRPALDATMHNPGCGYCHSPEMMEYFNRFQEQFDEEDRERRKFLVGELLDSIDGVLNLNITTEDLMRVAEIGKQLFYGAICTADALDNAEFFVGVYENWAAVVDAVLRECDRDPRNSRTGQARAAR